MFKRNARILYNFWQHCLCLSFLRNCFDGSTKLFLDQYLAKFFFQQNHSFRFSFLRFYIQVISNMAYVDKVILFILSVKLNEIKEL